MYKKTVIVFKRDRYDHVSCTSAVISHDGQLYIWKTCEKLLRKKNIPCQASCNKRQVVFLPEELKNVRRLERTLVPSRILFKKVTFMLKGNSPKMKGSLCNISISEVFDTCKALPRPPDSSGLVIVKLKRKVEYRSHELFKPVRPVFVEKFVNFLKSHNPLYSDIEINLNNVNLNFRNQEVTEVI